MRKGELVHNDHFFLFPQCFHLCLMISFALIEILNEFVKSISMSSASELLYVGKGLICMLWETIKALMADKGD